MTEQRIADLEFKQRELLQTERQLLTQIYGPQPFAPASPERARIPGLDLADEERKQSPEGTRAGKTEVQMFDDARLASARETEERRGDLVTEEPADVVEERKSAERNVHADKPKELLEQEIEEAKGQIKVAEAKLAECQAVLDKALPARAAAVEAVGGLDQAAIREITAYATPPTEVRTVCSAVMTVLEQPTTWP